MIDPKRLTEKDRGRAAVFKELWVGDPERGKIRHWDKYSDWILIDYGGRMPRRTHKMCLEFVAGTYQDGGAE